MGAARGADSAHDGTRVVLLYGKDEQTILEAINQLELEDQP